jgi:glycosyltransferase involved in cell wall biosynthesis
MAQRMKIEHKPFIVSEGFCDSSIYDEIPDREKYEKKTAMYAGNLSKLYGIRRLVDGFMLTEGDYELHFYGAGADADYIQECIGKDSRIRFFGRVSRQEILQAYKRSHLLVVNKPTADDYSNYSFSSKILEMMGSGTPVLTTRVGGMQEEYYPYFFFIEDETVSGLSKALSDVLRVEKSELNEMGISAREYAVNEKSYGSQSRKLVEFLRRINKHESKGKHDNEQAD